MTFYLGIAALVAVVLVFGLIICGARYDDTLNNTTDEHSEWLGIGGGDFIQHSGAVGAEGPNDHA